jgi:hypothetical protein
MRLLLRVAAIVFVALSLGASFAHLLELPAKLQLTGDRYLAVQQIYRYFGAIAAVLEIGSLVLLIVVVVLGWHRPARHLTVFALTVFAASLVTWAVGVSPVNTVFASWVGGPPVHWTDARDRWEWGHVAVFGLKLVSFTMLITAMLRSYRDSEVI